MSIRIVDCNVVQDSKEVVYSNGPHTVLLGPKRITLNMETDGPFPSTFNTNGTLEDWFTTHVLPLMDREDLRRIITEATALVLNPR